MDFRLAMGEKGKS